MLERKEKHPLVRPFLSFPFWEEDMWGIDYPSQTGLSVSEDEHAVYVEANLPGLKLEDIELSFEKGILWIKGDKQEEDKKKKFYRKASTSFSYRIQVPGQIDEKREPEASYKDGVVKVTFAKRPEAQAKKIAIKAK